MATVPTRTQDRLPDSAFAYIAPGGRKDSTGRTVPRSKRHLLIDDAAHVRDAAARFNQTQFHSLAAKRAAWLKIERAAGKFGIKLTKRLGANGQLIDRKVERAASDNVITSAYSVVIEGNPPEWVELLPCNGKPFKASDGRGPFTLSDPMAVIKASLSAAAGECLPIDYDHATDFAAPEGRPAPAAGWIRELAVRDGAIWGRVEWTERGAQSVSAKEYRFISPVFDVAQDVASDDVRGEITLIRRAALTNNPALELTAVASKRSFAMAKKSKIDALVEQIQEAADETGLPVDTLLEGISHKLGGDLTDPDGGGENDEPADDPADEGAAGGGDPAGAAPDDDDEEAMARERHREAAATRERDGIVEAPAERMERETAEQEELAAARKSKKAREDERRAGRLSNAERDARRAGDRNPREDALRDIHRTSARAIASHPTVLKMARELRDLQLERAREKATTAVTAAIRERRLPPSQRDWAIAYAMESPAGFQKFIKSMPVMIDDAPAAAGSPQQGVTLSRSELAVCSALKLDPKQFAQRRSVAMARELGA